MLEWKTWNQIVGVENAVPENAGPNRVGGKHRTGKRGTKFHRGGKSRTTIYGTDMELGHRVNGSFGSSFASGSPGHHFDPV